MVLSLRPEDEKYILERVSAVEDGLASISFSDPLLDEMTSYALNGGRRARPVMVLMAAEAANGKIDVTDKNSPVLAAAIAVELGHKASLIHDDMVDGDSMRRGRESFHKKYGVREGVIVADLLLGRSLSNATKLALDDNAKNECSRLFTKVFETMALGQAKDYSYERRKKISVAESIEMTYEKTAVLCEMPMRLGATIAGGSPDLVESLGAYGRNMGFAFQIFNDVNNVTGYESAVGRGQATDLASGKKTSLVAYAMDAACEDGGELLAEITRQGATAEGGVKDVLSLIASAKTVEAVSEMARVFMQRARKNISRLPGSKPKTVFEALADPQSTPLCGYFGLVETEAETDI